MTAVVLNLFPAEAVATYGAAQITCEDLGYMTEVSAELSRYLTAYSRDDARYGGAIGLRGVHGSGKTHVLAWLGDRARSSRSIRSTVLYGKCDSSKLFDLYRQLMGQMDRASVIELIQLALLNLARTKVRSAKVTEALAERLLSAGSLQELQREQNLDLEQLRQQLLAELQSRVDSKEMVRVLLDVPAASTGTDAYRWLSGNQIENPQSLGLNYQLSALPGAGETANADVTAITALQLVAALHRMAGVPLLVLVDQFEVLLRTSSAGEAETLGSLIKKFVEQLTSESALVFIAGIPEAWARLPRDVPARFRRREEIVVGSLSLEEAQLFVGSYSKNVPLQVVATIHKLAGGSPREILRIAHHAFEKTTGNLSAADEGVLLASAQRSGSIADRVRLALATVDSVLADFGDVARELAVPRQGALIDRVLRDPDGQVQLLIVIVKATDALDEIDSARRVQTIQKYQAASWPHARIVVVTVGYSSAEVRGLLSAVSDPIVFSEKTFETELRARLVSLPSGGLDKPAQEAHQREIANSLKQLESRLRELEQLRTGLSVRVQERFAEGVRQHAAPLVEEKKLATRREVLDALDELRIALARHELDAEQKILRSILIANEAYLRNALLEDLGELYIELLGMERYKDYAGSGAQLRRDELIARMRDSLRTRRGFSELLSRYAAAAFATATALFLATGVLSSYRASLLVGEGRQLLFLPYPYDFISVMPFVFLSLAVLVLYGWGAVSFMRSSSRGRYRAEIERIRSIAKEEDLRKRYPQSPR